MIGAIFSRYRPWIEDPFDNSKDMEAPIDGRCLANYAHIRLLSRNAATSTFSAAHNPVTSQSERADVVLKAARPNLWLINQNCYAEDLLRHERDILEIARQRGIDFLPSALDFFIEDKTAFLVLSSPRPPHLKNLEEHLLEKGGFAPHRSLKLAKSIIQKIYSLHSKNIAWGDAAARNILLSDTDDVFLIDFETANADPKEDVFKNDMMDIGKLLFSLVLPLPADTLSLINKNQCVGWIRMLSEAKYPEALLNSIYSCYSTHPPSARNPPLNPRRANSRTFMGCRRRSSRRRGRGTVYPETPNVQKRYVGRGRARRFTSIRLHRVYPV